MPEKTASDNCSEINPAANKRLPCRGCTEDCQSYHRCDGLLWRMSVSCASTESEASKS